MFKCEICMGSIKEGDKIIVGRLTIWPNTRDGSPVYVAHARCEGYGE